MIRSMTGFGRGEASGPEYRVSCEVRGVNHRYLDFNIRLSRRYAALEERIRERVKRDLARGRVEVTVNVERVGGGERSLQVDKELAMAYHKALIDLAQDLRIPSDFGLIDLFRLPEVFSLAEEAADLEGVWAVMAAALDQALREVLTMRETEGENLRRDLLGRTRLIEDFVETIAGRARDVPAEHAQRMRKRLSELLPDSPLDDVRLAQEVAIFADRASIDEEVVRLRSHLQQFTALLAGGGAVGRKADFVVQEMFRETNTIGSKANDSIIAGLVVEVKAELERVREQLQNIE